MDYENERRQRGEQFADWLRRVTADPRTGEMMGSSAIARAVGLSAGRVGVLLKGCIEHDGRISLPKAPTIDKIAAKFQADADEAKAIVGILPRKSANNIYIPEPGSQKFVLSTGDVIFSRPGERDAARRASLVEAYLVGIQSVTEERY